MMNVSRMILVVEVRSQDLNSKKNSMKIGIVTRKMKLRLMLIRNR